MKILRASMTDDEILREIATFYSDPDSWESYEKEYVPGILTERSPLAIRDQGEYARRGLAIIEGRRG